MWDSFAFPKFKPMVTHRPLQTTLFLLAFGFLSVQQTRHAFAQAPPDSGDAEAPSGAIANEGTETNLQAVAHVIVFVGGQPIKDVEVLLGEQASSAFTNEDGAAIIRAEQSLSAPLLLNIPTQHLKLDTTAATFRVRTPVINMVEGETVEVIVTVAPEGGIEKFLFEGVVNSEGGRDKERARLAEFEKLPKGTLKGVVTSVEDGKPVKGAQIFVRGFNTEAATDAEGRFSVALPEGLHDLSVIHASYSTQSKTGLLVKANATSETTIELSPASLELEEFVVLAPHVSGSVASLVQERRDSSAVSDVLGAQEMSRSGASDAASALQRVTGINIIGGRFVFVRGMGDRYSATLLNGQMIPSPDPERRVIPLDLFPVQVLESVVIQKTFSPDMPAEFGGGMVQLRTRSYPDKFTLNINLQLGLNTQMTFARAPTHDGGSLDWLGMDDGSRALPSEIEKNSPLRAGSTLEPGFSRDELSQFGTLLNNNYNVDKTTVPVNRKASVTGGDRFTIGKAKLGYFASGVYSDEYEFLRTKFISFSLPTTPGRPLSVLDDLNITTLLRTVSSGGMLSLGAEYYPGQKITVSSLLLRVTDISTDVVNGFNLNLGTQVRQLRLRFIERQMWAQQIVGEQTIAALNDAKLDWRFSTATAKQNSPDQREYLYLQRGGENTPFSLGDQNNRIFSTLKDDMNTLNVDYTQPLWKPEAKLKLGTMLVYRDRGADTFRFVLRPNSLDSSTLQQAPEQIFRPENFTSGRLNFLDVTRGTDAYSAKQRIQSGYMQTEIPITDGLEVMAGARVERSLQDVTTFDPFDPTNEVKAKLDNTDFLPAATSTLKITDEMALRAGFGRTVSRPDFRELSLAVFVDVTNGFTYIGNPDLQRATINNYDLRYEWFLSPEEVISFGAFYKTFAQPIELVILGGAEPTFTWRNAEAATNVGLEMEGRKELDFISDSLENVFLGSNIAIIQSNVNIGDQSGQTATSKERPLQGQAPFVVNAQIGYDNTLDYDFGTSATLLYNVTGPYISQVGAQGLPDMYQQPLHQLDFVLRQKLPLDLTVSFRAQNLLNPESRQTQNGQVARSFRRGRALSLSLQWDY